MTQSLSSGALDDTVLGEVIAVVLNEVIDVFLGDRSIEPGWVRELVKREIVGGETGSKAMGPEGVPGGSTGW